MIGSTKRYFFQANFQKICKKNSDRAGYSDLNPLDGGQSLFPTSTVLRNIILIELQSLNMWQNRHKVFQTSVIYFKGKMEGSKLKALVEEAKKGLLFKVCQKHAKWFCASEICDFGLCKRKKLISTRGWLPTSTAPLSAWTRSVRTTQTKAMSSSQWKCWRWHR